MSRAKLLQLRTKAEMELFESTGNFEQCKENLRRYAVEVLEWFTTQEAVQTHTNEVASTSLEDKTSYYRALFNLTTEAEMRMLLVELDVIRIAVNCVEREPDVIVVAALANLVYEEPTKVKLVNEFRGIKIFSDLLSSDNVHTKIHAARGIFSVTTLYAFKKMFAQEPGLLLQLVSCLTLENDALTMNAAGALANIAIHPESKIPIVEVGGLARLLDLSLISESEPVLHQVSRCLFSLAADRSNRVLMCKEGVLNGVLRMLSFDQNAEILSNTIGCFGNLAMTEREAQESYNLIDRILPIFIQSEDGPVDRQAARVLCSIYFKDYICSLPIKSSLLIALKKRIMNAKDANVVRDVCVIFAALLRSEPSLRDDFFAPPPQCENDLFSCLGKFKKDMSNDSREDVDVNVLLAVASLLGDSYCNIRMFGETNTQRLGKICDKAQIANRYEPIRRVCLEILAVLSAEPALQPAIFKYGGLEIAVGALFSLEASKDRKSACDLFKHVVGSSATSFVSSMDQFGGVGGESRRLASDLRHWFTANCLCSPTGENEKLRTNFIKIQNQFKFYQPLVQVRCPTLLVTLQGNNEGLRFRHDQLRKLGEVLHSNNRYEPQFVGNTDDDFDDDIPFLMTPWNFAMEKMLISKVGVDVTFRMAGNDTEPAVQNIFLTGKSKTAISRSPFLQNLLANWAFWKNVNCPTGKNQAFLPCPLTLEMDLELDVEDDFKESVKKLSSSNRKRSRTLTSSSSSSPSEHEIFVRAHKAILAARCPYFKVLFEGPFKEQNVDNIDFRSSVDAFILILRYFYMGLDDPLRNELRDQPELAFDVLLACHEYGVTALQYYCEFVITQYIFSLKDAAEWAAKLLSATELLNVPCLRARCATLLQSRTAARFAEDDVLQGVLRDFGYGYISSVRKGKAIKRTGTTSTLVRTRAQIKKSLSKGDTVEVKRRRR